MGKPREFWIKTHTSAWSTPGAEECSVDTKPFDKLWATSQSIHVIEHAAYAKAVAALKWYANEENYNIEGAPCNDRPGEENGGFPNEYDWGKRATDLLRELGELE